MYRIVLQTTFHEPTNKNHFEFTWSENFGLSEQTKLKFILQFYILFSAKSCVKYDDINKLFNQNHFNSDMDGKVRVIILLSAALHFAAAHDSKYIKSWKENKVAVFVVFLQ